MDETKVDGIKVSKLPDIYFESLANEILANYCDAKLEDVEDMFDTASIVDCSVLKYHFDKLGIGIKYIWMSACNYMGWEHGIYAIIDTTEGFFTYKYHCDSDFYHYHPNEKLNIQKSGIVDSFKLLIEDV